jgi:hypothetical protein
MEWSRNSGPFHLPKSVVAQDCAFGFRVRAFSAPQE